MLMILLNFIAFLLPSFSSAHYKHHWVVFFDDDVSFRASQKLASAVGLVSHGPINGDLRMHHFASNRDHESIDDYLKRYSAIINNVRGVKQTYFNREKRGFKTFHDLISKFPDNIAQPNDPAFKFQWYLKNLGHWMGKKGLDLNVEEAWSLGYTGKNITVAILDDGVDYTHPDLMHNYNSMASYDFSSDDPYPYPRYTDDWFNSHGTRCAGEVSASRNNNICGVGVAFDAKIAGIRMLDQPYMTDLIEAVAIGHLPNSIDIYSASWGPTDDGTVVDGPRHATLKAMIKGINEGRNGKGNIYVWASGDGGPNDDCNCDGYTNSMWTISINSAVSDGETAIYDESCSSTLASTFSNGRHYTKRKSGVGVATTDLYGQCTLYHSGTSASAPQAAGVFALALEANPNLTWRDVQHLTVLTAKRNHLYDPNKLHLWELNGAGLEFNHLFGYGVLNAGEIVKLAKQWKPMPLRRHCMAGQFNEMTIVNPGQKLVVEMNTTACKGTDNEVNFLEHVQSFVTIRHGRRGNIVIYLTSPLETRSLLLQRRSNDNSTHGFNKWPFMTTHMWAEKADGLWKLEIILNNDIKTNRGALTFYEWILVLHGTKEKIYENQIPLNMNTKLAVSQKIHQNNFKEIKRFTSALKHDNQKRIGDNPTKKI